MHSVDEIVAWLSECTYARDPDLFHEADYWQHPLTFEQLRRGDCEDFALWAWRKLVKLGRDAEFVAGRILNHNSQSAGHAWVHLRTKEGLFLLESVLPGADTLYPQAEIRDKYMPEVSVDGCLLRYAYGGYYLLRREALNKNTGAGET